MCIQLGRLGLSPTEISRRTGVPRPTVRDWLNGRVPRSGKPRRSGCEACGHGRHTPEDLPSEYVYLLGIYLGDGCISSLARGVFKLRVSLDAKYPEIRAEVERAVRAVMPRNKVGYVDYGTWVELVSYSRSWPCLFPQHGPGRKHERPIVLTDWQQTLVERQPELLLRGLIQSDGCRFENTGRCGWRNPRYLFTNASDDIRGIFIAACERVGLHTTQAPRTVYVSRKADVARMDEFVGPKA